MVKWTNCQPKTSDWIFMCMHLWEEEYGILIQLDHCQNDQVTNVNQHLLPEI